MESVVAILEREGDALEVLLFKLVETRLLLEADESRFVPRATREVERARTRCRELGLLRAATVAQIRPGATLRALAHAAHAPWAAILRDHHALLGTRLAEIEVVAHQNASLARTGISALSQPPVAATVSARRSGVAVLNPELDHLARGAALDAVLGSAARLRMPDLVDFLH